MLPTLDERVLRGRSLGPTFNADLRKSLFAHFEPFDELVPFDDAVDVDVGMVFVGDSLGTGGGNERDPFGLCLTGLGCFVPFVDGLLVFDFSERPTEFDRELDVDFDIELSRDFDDAFSLLIASDRLWLSLCCDVLLCDDDVLLLLLCFIREKPFDAYFVSI